MNGKVKMVAIISSLCLVTIVSFSSCGANAAIDKTGGGQASTGFGNSYQTANDSVDIGTLATYDAESAASAEGGSAIKGSDEDAHQQDLIAGGNSGAVTSKNLPALSGIASIDEYTSPGDGTGVSPKVPHTVIGKDCTLCHIKGTAPHVPESHVEAGLTASQCLDCHQQEN